MNELVVKSEWDEVKSILSENAKRRARKKTPKSAISRRQGRAGQTWDYVKKGVVRKTLDDNIPGWSFSVDSVHMEQTALSIFVVGTLRFIEEGVMRSISDIGGSEIKLYVRGENAGKPLNLANDAKAAVTDCIRRCGARMGFFSDIYEEAEVEEIPNELLKRIDLLADHHSLGEIGKKQAKKMKERLTTPESARELIAKLEAHIDASEKADEIKTR